MFLWPGCDSSSRKDLPRGGEAPVRFQVRGVLHNLSPDHRRAVIAHEDIANYMKAMTMEFEIGDPPEAASLERGDILSFRLSVTETKSWIDEIRKMGHTELPAATDETAQAPTAIPTNLPDVALIDQHGQTFHLGDLRGRTVAITFFFTRCPLPNFCPLMNRNFETVRRDLAATIPTERWRLVSITIDPANDTPEELTRYAANFETNPEQWTFPTGALEDIRSLGSTFGLEVVDANGQINHNLRTVVVNPDGRVRRVFDGNDGNPRNSRPEEARDFQRALIYAARLTCRGDETRARDRDRRVRANST